MTKEIVIASGGLLIIVVGFFALLDPLYSPGAEPGPGASWLDALQLVLEGNASILDYPSLLVVGILAVMLVGMAIWAVITE